jgi:hypothetical protein
LSYPTPVPESLSFTEGPEESMMDSPEISILIDLSDEIMLREVRPRGKVVVIDHHRTDWLVRRCLLDRSGEIIFGRNGL